MEVALEEMAAFVMRVFKLRYEFNSGNFSADLISSGPMQLNYEILHSANSESKRMVRSGCDRSGLWDTKSVTRQSQV